ncbi:MspA family porin [Nocardia fluminea]|uniref:MspA family porin n=1 Tax=Nocardia fluminea TaxID=134984 RepID=UPI0038172925
MGYPAVGLALGAGSAAAVIDSSSIVLDGENRTVEAIQSDTRIDFVAPLDGNPLTREWFHSAGIELAAGFGPGVQEVEVVGGEIAGAEGVLRLSGFHGTVTGVLGQTNVRPFVRIVGSSGDTVVTYGKTFSI